MNWDIIVNFICVAAHSVRTMVLGIYCSKVMLLMPDGIWRSILFKSGLEKNISKLGYNRSSKARMGLSKYNQ